MAEQVCKWCQSAIEKCQAEPSGISFWRHKGNGRQACALIQTNAEPASPSAAGEPPRKQTIDGVWHLESCQVFWKANSGYGYPCNCGAERGNQPQGNDHFAKMHMREKEEAESTSKAPGVGAEPLSCADCETPVCEHVARDVADLRRQLEQWTQWGIIEVAVRNPQVAEYMEHWEKRAEAAEQKLSAIADADYILNVDATWKAKNAEIAELKAKLVAALTYTEHHLGCAAYSHIGKKTGNLCSCGLDDLKPVAAALPSEEAIAQIAKYVIAKGFHSNPQCHRGSDDGCFCGLEELQKAARAVLAMLKGEK